MGQDTAIMFGPEMGELGEGWRLKEDCKCVVRGGAGMGWRSGTMYMHRLMWKLKIGPVAPRKAEAI
jgi:hypothetical protein